MMDETIPILRRVLEDWRCIAKADHEALAKYDAGKKGPCIIVLDITRLLNKTKIVDAESSEKP